MADPKIVLYGAARPEVERALERKAKAGPTYETKIVIPVKPAEALPVEPPATQDADPAAPRPLEGEVGTQDGLGRAKDRAGK